MKKLNIAVLFGGCSPEYGVSLESAAGLIPHIDPTRFTPVLIGISRQGDWYHFTGTVEEIARDTWLDGNCTPAALSPSRSRHELLVLHPEGAERVPLDAALPILHGRNGEDGTVQGLMELAGIPLAGCGTLASALCMDKRRAHELVSLAGIRVPASAELTGDWTPEQVRETAETLGYPLFVKPVNAGSSYGVARVEGPEMLLDAVRAAFRYDGRVLLEEAIPGFEVGCAVMGNETLRMGEPDEIELSGGFFDFTEKYDLVTARIHVPARISPAQMAAVKAAAGTIYRALGCRGFARVDMFLTPAGEIVFNEVNTIPGFTPHSRFPGMMAAAGMSFGEMVSRMIEMAVEP